MVTTAERASEQVQKKASAVSDWIADTASQIADPIAEATEKIDLEGTKEAIGDAAGNTADTVGSVASSLVGVAPVAALATKRALRRSTFLGLAVSAAFAWFFEPNQGKERRNKAVGLVKDAWSSITKRFSSPEVTTNPSMSNQNFNDTHG